MTPIVVSDILAVGEVPNAEQIAILARAGFKSVINNQPDGEVDRFPGSAALAADAAKVGLGYVYAPVVNRTPTPEELSAFNRALRDLPSPIYAFCYSGARSAAVAAFAQAEQGEPDDIIREFSQAGFDIQALKPWLDDAHTRKAAISDALASPRAKAETDKDATAASQMPARPPVQPGIVVHARAAGFSGFAM